MQTKNHAHTAICIATLVIASLVLGGCLSSEENVEDFSGGNSVNTPTNSAPVISGNPTTVVNVGGFYSFVPTASDADGDALTFSIENKPTWASFNSGSGEVSGQPTLGDVGVYQNIRISVTDGADSASLQPSLSINVCPPGSEANCCVSTPTAYDDENGPPGNGIVIGDLLTRPDTFHSIGFVWDIDGDADHDGSVSVRYRKAGACNFAPAMPLIRNDYAWFWNGETAAEPANNFAGSLMFLTPGTTYEVVLELNDPDGGRAIRVRELTTRAIPRKPTAGRTLHVVPGNGGGGGSSADPIRGLGAANAAAQPGDTLLLHVGTYAGTSQLSASGQAGNYIVWRPAGDGTPIIEALEITGDHIWIDQLTFRRNADENAIDVPWAQPRHAPDDIVITNSDFTGYERAIVDLYNGTRWTIMDNTIVGDKPVGVWSAPQNINTYKAGAGITISKPGGHVVAYNSITQVGDAIDAGEDSDVYGNDIFDTSDDSIEADASESNVRVWGNRMHQSGTYNTSFQPQYSGPWYFLYNQIAENRFGPIKWRVQDRIVFVNNTIIGGTGRAQYFMRTVTRNNLFIGGGPIWSASNPGGNYSPPQWLPSWNTDVDYDGFDWGGSGNAFSWFDGTAYYPDLPSFVAAVGIEQNGIQVDRNDIFENYVVSRDHALTLNPSGNAVDAGAYLPNLADFYLGTAPDLGAHERGATARPYGPRGSGTPLDQHALYWAKH